MRNSCILATLAATAALGGCFAPTEETSTEEQALENPITVENLWEAQQVTSEGPTSGVTAFLAAGRYDRLTQDLAAWRQLHGLGPAQIQVIDQRGGTSFPVGFDLSAAKRTAEMVEGYFVAAPSKPIVVVLADSIDPSDLSEAIDTLTDLGVDEIGSALQVPATALQDLAPTLSAAQQVGVRIAASMGLASGDGFGGNPSAFVAHEGVFGIGTTKLIPAANSRGWVDEVFSRSISTDTRGADLSAPGANVELYLPDGQNSASTQVVDSDAFAMGFAVGALARAPAIQIPSDLTQSLANDVTTGANGTCGTSLCQGVTGKDGPSGYGTPIVSAFDGQ